MEVFEILLPKAPRVPILLSSPHSGTFFPKDLRNRFQEKHLKFPDDADWHIDKLYEFASEMGITIIKANYCRWVIDLNRDAEQKPLYNDGRVITGLVPTTDFNGNPLYNSIQDEPSADEIQERIEKYYLPYHQKIEELLQDLQSEFDEVLLWDCHSIRDFVPGIRSEVFPQLILGDNDQQSASKKIIDTALNLLNKGQYEVSHNYPFKGGAITRNFGNPEKKRHTLQLEMTKKNYMDDTQTIYDIERASKMQTLLKSVFEGLINTLK